MEGDERIPEHVKARFWSKVDVGRGFRDNACWNWRAGTSAKGYGTFRLDNGSTVQAHRFAWRIFYGEAALHVLHACDNPRCCNPRHLFVGTNADNVADRCAKGRTHAKLSPRDVAQIRELRGAMSQRNIAARFGVSQPLISLIQTRRLASPPSTTSEETHDG